MANEFKIKNGAIVPTIESEEQASTPGNPASGNRKLYAKEDGWYQLDDGGNETKLGSGGAGGINYIDNPDAESGTTGWATYADTAGEDPVDGTGGSPTVTLTQNTTTPLRGVGDFKITKDGSDRQGEGVSYDFVIDEADKNKTLEISFDYDASNANFTSGDSSDIRVWIYDKDNTTLIQPTNYTIQASTGTFVARFPATDADDYRLIFHIATTNASAWDFYFDNISVGPKITPRGLSGSGWEQVSPTWNNVTVGNGTNVAYKRRVGSNIEVFGILQLGSTSSISGEIDLDTITSFGVNPSSLMNSVAIVGSTNAYESGGTHHTGVCRIVQSTGILIFTMNSASTNANATIPFTWGNGDEVVYKFSYETEEWNANISMANGTTYRMSSILANGTQVTGGSPTKLGEYRSMYTASGSSNSLTDTTPSTLPTSTDGARLYASPYDSAGTSGQPSYYEVFVGYNKHITIRVWEDSGFTNVIDHTLGWGPNNTELWGIRAGYNPTTGIVYLDAATENKGTTTSRYLGVRASGAAAVTDGYFDIVVSENALAVGMELPRSEVWVHTGNGYGSTNTKIRQFTTTQKNTGDAITYASSSTDGGSWTINEDGIYEMVRVDGDSTGSTQIGISLNSASLTTNAQSLSASELIAYTTNPSTYITSLSTGPMVLQKGDVLRCHDSGACDGTTNYNSWVRITKVSD